MKAKYWILGGLGALGAFAVYQRRPAEVQATYGDGVWNVRGETWAKRGQRVNMNVLDPSSGRFFDQRGESVAMESRVALTTTILARREGKLRVELFIGGSRVAEKDLPTQATAVAA